MEAAHAPGTLLREEEAEILLGKPGVSALKPMTVSPCLAQGRLRSDQCRILRWDRILDDPGGLNIITRVYK